MLFSVIAAEEKDVSVLNYAPGKLVRCLCCVSHVFVKTS